MADYQLGVIGCGNMAEALLRGVIASNFMPLSAIVAADPAFERRQLFTGQLQIASVADNAAAASCPRVLLAVKPQVMGDVLAGIAAHVRADATVVSIAAGITTAFLDARLEGKGRIVRVMPNTPMLVGAGMTVLCAGPRATPDDLNWARKLFAVCGEAVVAEERLMDAVTAISGSGPAYFFYLIEAMIAAGVAEGLDPAVAKRLAVQTCVGAASLLVETAEPPEGLRARVTSPGGTTQRAIEAMDAAGVKDTLVAAVRAAAERSRELGK
ncbi:MAG TPA: pyrroline-5-carboxylate reductase [Phycisphaerae bacterium]|nr:pyrroline-5-carboxylate reductase [Phycisphaerae bacterium]HUU57966.1 pyrroline-5-carboxylate reductase [Phycisphaerae bacterium]